MKRTIIIVNPTSLDVDSYKDFCLVLKRRLKSPIEYYLLPKVIATRDRSLLKFVFSISTIFGYSMPNEYRMSLISKDDDVDYFLDQFSKSFDGKRILTLKYSKILGVVNFTPEQIEKIFFTLWMKFQVEDADKIPFYIAELA